MMNAYRIGPWVYRKIRDHEHRKAYGGIWNMEIGAIILDCWGVKKIEEEHKNDKINTIDGNKLKIERV